jgi:site-specific DNA-methyltransferase (cytosine-N4-specific)
MRLETLAHRKPVGGKRDEFSSLKLNRVEVRQPTLIRQEFSLQDFETLINDEHKTKKERYHVLDLIGWDFKNFQTQYLTHHFHSYPARFIPQIPKTFIRLFTKEGDTVIDPFCGCGTTIVEAFLNGRDSIGNDFNPLACLITRAKTRLISDKELDLLDKNISKIKRYVDSDHRRREYLKKLPKRNVSNLFNRDMINEICLIKEGLDELEDKEALYELGLVALSATIWSVIEAENEIDIFANFYKKNNSMMSIVREFGKVVEKPPQVTVISGDARDLQIDSKISPLIVTSPPYVNALDYYRVHMYNMLWLGLDYENFRKHEIGGHSHFIANRFRLLTEYLADMLRAMMEMNRVLKRGGVCVIAVGNSSLEYELIESYKFFLAFAKHVNFKPVKAIFRNIDTTRKYSSRDIGKIDDEYIVVLEKERDLRGISAKDDGFVEEVVTKLVREFEQRVKEKPGSSLRGKRVSKERLEKNAERIAEAIKFIPQDIKIKK